MVLVGLFALAAAARAAEPGLVGYWTFDEGSGTTTGDLSGNGFTGTLLNGPQWVTGFPSGQALEFDGVDDRVEVGNPAALQITGALTLAAWVRVDSYSGNGRIVTKGGASGQRGWSLNVESFNAYAFQVAGDASTTIAVNATNIALNQWVHLAGVFDPIGPALRLYTNGVLAVTRTSGVPASHFNSPLNVAIGARPVSQTFFDGRIDEVRIYNRALDAAEIAALSGMTPSAPEFIAEPVSQTVMAPQPVTFSAAVRGSTPLSYQWFSNGVALAGATSTACTIPVTSTNMSGTWFAVRVTNALGSLTSTNAVLTVIAAPPQVGDTRFSVDRGFFVAPFALEISTETPGATIRFTLDGSAPDTNRGTIYTGPLTLTRTTTLRALAYKDGLLPTDVDTQTYIFLSDVLQQGNQPPGFPATWVNASGATVYNADYEMNPQILNDSRYRGQLSNALMALPSLSVVMDQGDLFGVSGLYVNGASGQNSPWQRPGSIELIHPDGHPGFQINCGISPHSHVKQKRAFRLYFQSEYGPGKLHYPLFADAPFGDSAVDEFDHLVLRSSQNDSWQSTSFQGNSARYATYTRDQMVRDTLLAVAGFGARGTYLHLYINGLYWGLYNLVERPDDWFTSAYFGGDETDWYAVNHSGPMAGDPTRFNAMHSFALANNLALLDNWNTLTQYLHVTAFVDYLIVQNYSGVGDWPNNNWYAGNRNTPPGTVRYFTWDAEDCWVQLVYDNGTTLRSSPGPWIHPGLLNSSQVQDFHRNSQIARFYRALTNSAEFRLAWADRTYQHCFHGGALVESNLFTRWDALSAWVELPIVAESARWGDVLNGAGVPYNPFTPQHWTVARDTLRSNMVNAVSRWIAVCRAYGLYPPNDPPQFSQHGGAVPVGFSLAVTGGTGRILYTLDRTDPRLPGGAVSPAAQTYAAPLIITSNVTVKARLLTSGTWSALAEATFYPPQDFSRLALTELMYNPPRFGGVDGEEFEFIELKNTGAHLFDLTGLRFHEGIDYRFPDGATLAPGQFLVLVRNTNQFAAKYPGVAWFGVYTGKLANEGERVSLTNALGARLLALEYGDRAPWPVAADGSGFSLVPLDPINRPSSDQGALWRASAQPGGSPGAEDPEPIVPTVVINEVLTSPLVSPPAPSDRGAGPISALEGLAASPTTDAIELFNPTETPADISGWYLTDDGGTPSKFRIPEGTVLAPGAFAVFTETDFNPTPGTNEGFAFDHDGEQVYVFSADALGNLTGYAHGFSFGAAEPGVAFGRYLTSTGEEHFPAQVALTFGTNNAGPRVGPVVFTEIHYHPAAGGDEFLELQNVTAVPVPLYDAARPTNTWRITGLGWHFPTNVALPPGGTLLIVATNPPDFRVKYGVPTNVSVFGPYPGALQDSGEMLALDRPGPPGTNGSVLFITVDAVRYNDKAPWPVEADGLGPSLERIHAPAYGNDPGNWRASAAEGGTPGWIPTPPAVPLIAVGSSQITLSAYVGEDTAPVFLQIWNSGASNLVFELVNTNTFLSVTPGTGTSTGPADPSVHRIDVASATLPIGTYVGSLLVHDAGSGASNGPVAVTITLTISPEPTPQIGLSPHSLAASTDAGAEAAALGFNLWNDGVGTLDYTIAANGEWLTVTPASGSRRNIEPPQWHNVSFHTASLPPGIHTAALTVRAPGALPEAQHLPVLVELRAPALFTAYNDFAWAAGQLNSNITTHTTAAGGGGGDGGGTLVDFATGQPTGVYLAITGGAYYGDWQAALGNLSAPGTDAYQVFQDRVDCHGSINYAAAELVLAFAGLDPAARYEAVVFGNRDSATFSNRMTTVFIEGAASFLNASTPGAIITGLEGATTTIASGDNTAAGQVARYTYVRCAPDGTFRLRVPGADASEQSKYYLNALMLRAHVADAAPQLRLTAYPDGLLILGWIGAGYLLESSPSLDGPWEVSGNQSNPQIVVHAAATTFYRLRR